MPRGISNFQIENVIKTINDEDLLKNFVGVFPSDEMTRFIDYKQLINQKTGQYLFLISNTQDSTKDGEHWWSILDIAPKNDSFLFLWHEGLKNFIITDNKKAVQKNLSGIEKMTQTGDKITLVNIKFSMKPCKKLSNKKIGNLSDTARDFFYFVQSFGDFLKVKDFLNIWMVEEPVQLSETVTCGIF